LQRGQRIHEAGRETPQASVAQAHVVLDPEKLVDVEPQVVHGLLRALVQAAVDQVVVQHPAHEVFQRQIVDAAGVALCLRLHRIDELLEDAVLHGLAGGDPPVALGRTAGVAGEREGQVVQDRGLDALAGRLDVEAEPLPVAGV
jgi:hypothetical protein